MTRLFDFENLYNVRELGGYATADGRITRRGKYLRGTAEGGLTEAEKEFLYNYGIRAVVDLRYPGELARTASPLKDYKDIHYRNVDLLGDFIPHLGSDSRGMGDLYVTWLDMAQESLAQVFRLFAKYNDAGVLFHCAVGKDRTGIIAALLLSLAGCSRADIIGDYTESYANNRAIYERMNVPPEQMRFLYSSPEYIETALRHLDDRYGGAASYLEHIGISASLQQRLRESFLAPLVIRPETPEDFDAVLELVKTAFQTARVSGGEEPAMVAAVRQSDRYLPELTLVAEADRELIGCLMLSRTSVRTATGEFPCLLLGPVCTLLEYRNRKIGEQLIRRALDLARRSGHTAVFLAGDRHYYRRFGFVPASGYGIRCQYDIPPELLDNILSLELRPGALKGVSGTVAL